MFLNLNDYCNLVKKRFIIKFNRLLWKSFYKGDAYESCQSRKLFEDESFK